MACNVHGHVYLVDMLAQHLTETDTYKYAYEPAHVYRHFWNGILFGYVLIVSFLAYEYLNEKKKRYAAFLPMLNILQVNLYFWSALSELMFCSVFHF